MKDAPYRFAAIFAVALMSFAACSSAPQEKADPPSEKASEKNPRPRSRPRSEVRRTNYAELPAGTSAPNATDLVVRAQSSRPFWPGLAAMDRASVTFALLFGGMLWLTLSLLSIFYRYQLHQAGFGVRAFIAFLIVIPFTLFWTMGSAIALVGVGLVMITLLIGTMVGRRREKLRVLDNALDRSAFRSVHEELASATPGLTLRPPGQMKAGVEKQRDDHVGKS